MSGVADSEVIVSTCQRNELEVVDRRARASRAVYTSERNHRLTCPISKRAPDRATTYVRDDPSSDATTSTFLGRSPSICGNVFNAAAPELPVVKVAVAVTIPAPGGSVTVAWAVEFARVPLKPF